MTKLFLSARIKGLGSILILIKYVNNPHHIRPRLQAYSIIIPLAILSSFGKLPPLHRTCLKDRNVSIE